MAAIVMPNKIGVRHANFCYELTDDIGECRDCKRAEDRRFSNRRRRNNKKKNSQFAFVRRHLAMYPVDKQAIWPPPTRHQPCKCVRVARAADCTLDEELKTAENLHCTRKLLNKPNRRRPKYAARRRNLRYLHATIAASETGGQHLPQKIASPRQGKTPN